MIAAEFRDGDTARHILRLSHYSAVLAKALHMSPGETELLGHAVTMHDVGKIGIPDAILRKRGALDAEERAVMQRHTSIGASILADSPSELMQQGQIVALTHHEHWDGGGYPRGLRGEEIPLSGRICSLADVFDAMTTARPYRPPFPPEVALAEMRQGRGRQFDPRLLDLFMEQSVEVLAVRERLVKEAEAAEAEPLGVPPSEAVGVPPSPSPDAA